MPDFERLKAYATEAERWRDAAPTEFERGFAEFRIELLAPMLKFGAKGKWDQVFAIWGRERTRYHMQRVTWQPMAQMRMDPEGKSLTAAIALKLLEEVSPFVLV